MKLYRFTIFMLCIVSCNFSEDQLKSETSDTQTVTDDVTKVFPKLEPNR